MPETRKRTPSALISHTIKEIFMHDDFKFIMKTLFCEVLSKEMRGLTLKYEHILMKISQLESALIKHAGSVESWQDMESSSEEMSSHQSTVDSQTSRQGGHQSSVNSHTSLQSTPLAQRTGGHESIDKWHTTLRSTPIPRLQADHQSTAISCTALQSTSTRQMPDSWQSACSSRPTLQSTPRPQGQDDRHLMGQFLLGEETYEERQEATAQHSAVPEVVCKEEAIEELTEEERSSTLPEGVMDTCTSGSSTGEERLDATAQHSAVPEVVCKEEAIENLTEEERSSTLPEGGMDTCTSGSPTDDVTQLENMYQGMKEEEEAQSWPELEESNESLRPEDPSSSRTEAYAASRWPSRDDGAAVFQENNTSSVCNDRTRSYQDAHRGEERVPSIQARSGASISEPVHPNDIALVKPILVCGGRMEEQELEPWPEQEETFQGLEAEGPSSSCTNSNTASQRPSMGARVVVSGELKASSSFTEETLSAKENTGSKQRASSSQERVETHAVAPTVTSDPPVCVDSFGKWRFQCGLCLRRFTSMCNLQTHYRLHTGELPFQCTVCGRRMNERGSLVRHMRVHTGERPYQCSFCLKTFSYRYSMLRHIKRYHRGNQLPSHKKS